MVERITCLGALPRDGPQLVRARRERLDGQSAELLDPSRAVGWGKLDGQLREQLAVLHQLEGGLRRVGRCRAWIQGEEEPDRASQPC